MAESYDARQCRAISELRAALSEQADETHRMIAALSEARAERDAAIAAGQNMANALKRNCPCYCDHPLRADLPPCSRCSSLAAWAAVSGSSEPR